MKVDSVVPAPNHKYIICRFNLTLDPGITIRDIRLMHGNKGRWIAWPNRNYRDKEDKLKYFDYVVLDKSAREKIETDIRAQLDKLMGAQQPKPPEPPRTDVEMYGSEEIPF